MISVSGIRGIVGESLTPDVALRFASAFASTTQARNVVLSSDGRPSGAMLRHAVFAGLLASGCEVHDIGVAPTPTFGFAISHLQASGGIQITASHNPAPWNGLKLFDKEGKVLSPEDGRLVRAAFETPHHNYKAWNQLGTVHQSPQALDWHLQRVLKLIDASCISARNFRIFVDANGGAGGPIARMLLNSLNCRATFEGAEADGHFAHEPEPTATNLAEICPLVPQNKADIGFALDPDADRLALIDEQGRYIGEELTLALAVRHRLTQKRGPIVVNMSTSRINEDLASAAGVQFQRAAVGEANVVSKMREIGALIGGEGNGGVIDPRVGWVRDPFIGMGLVLELMAQSKRKLSELVADLPHYDIVKNKYEIDPSRLSTILKALRERWPQAAANSVDGLRLDWPDRWLHVRSSNTEPIVRVIAEAPTTSVAQALCQEVETVIRGQNCVTS
jgi:phosphomannomutase